MSEPERTGREARTDTDESDANKFDWDHISYVTASQYRVVTLRELDDQPATPSQIAETTGEHPAVISRALTDMRENGLVELLVSEDRQKRRFYGMTSAGETVLDYLDEEGGAA